MGKIIKLNGTWSLRWFDGERGDAVERVLAGTGALDRAWRVKVPGSVHEALLEQGLIDDPNVGCNVLKCRWVEEMKWIYRRTFKAPRLGNGERAWLVFDCLDLAAVVYLNGTEVGRHANSFYPFRKEVTDLLQAGQNTLVVEIGSGLFHTMNRDASGYHANLHGELTKRPWLRKPQSEHGWDWSPRLLNVGITGDAWIETCKDVRWEHCAVLSDLDADLATGRVTARVSVEGLNRRPLRRRLRVTVGKIEQSKTVTIKPGMNRLELSLTVPNPRLWWPVGHGKPHRSVVHVELQGVGAGTKKVGFRHVRIRQDRHPETGSYFILEINGKPIFCKGGNLVPSDLIRSRIDRRRYMTLVDRALESNFNMLRVWGGGHYEATDFYEICDARGILVWQEFIFACAKYPTTDSAFLADVKREAAYQIRRLAHHPSLVVWCGNNEMELGNYEWGYDVGVAHPDYALFHMVLPCLLAEEDGTRYYQPSSPFSPALAYPNANHVGDQHPWDVGIWDGDFRKYRDMICRFPNEGGVLGPNALPTVRACADRIGSFGWELHDNSVSYRATLPPYAPDAMIHEWTGRKVADMSIEDYVYWAGLVHGAGLGEYIKNFRRRMFDSAAAIYWMYNDVWPCSRSWTTVDYYRRRTPAFWPVKRAMAPVAVVIARDGERVRVYGVNDGAAVNATLRFGLLRLAGGYPVDETRDVRLEANASTPLAEFDAVRWDKLGVRTHVAFAILEQDSVELARDTMIAPRFHEMKWPTAHVRVKQKQGKVVFTCDTFAWRVCLDLDGERALADNFFDIYPDIPTVLDWCDAFGKPDVLRIGNAGTRRKR